jgi:hypothetical protein
MIMNLTDIDAELKQPGAQALLKRAPLLRLAYIGTDDSPRVIPIGFHWTGADIVLSTATTAPKVRALSKRPQVAITIDDDSTPESAHSLLVRGTSTLDTIDGVPDEYLAGAAKSLDGEKMKQFEANARSTYQQMINIRIAPTWARYFSVKDGSPNFSPGSRTQRTETPQP